MKKATLKKLSIVFFAMEAATFAAQISNGVTCAVLSDKAYKAYKTTTEYKQDLDKKQAELLEKINSGEITLEESSKELESYTSTKEVTKRLKNGNEQVVKTMYTMSQNMAKANWALSGGVILSCIAATACNTSEKCKED